MEWQALGRLHKSLSWQQRATHIKFIFRWAPTNSRKLVTGQSTTSTFRLCQEAEETILHMLHCPCDKATEGQDIALKRLADSLDVCDTHPDMVLLLIHLVETEGAPHKGIGRDSDISFTAIMDTQSMIG